jgi:hypothetical protein
MKICPGCNQTYADENLNFCLNDGELLQQFGDDAPPTIMMDSSRTTNPKKLAAIRSAAKCAAGYVAAGDADSKSTVRRARIDKDG